MKRALGRLVCSIPVLVGLAASVHLGAQEPAEAPAATRFRVVGDRPRLLLTARKIRFLRRERERASIRWSVFQSVVRSQRSLPQEAFAAALYFRVTDDSSLARQAIAAALAPAADIRDDALVYDWCYGELRESEKRVLLERLTNAARARPKQPSISELRSQTFAAIAIAGDNDPDAESALHFVVEAEWFGRIVPGLRAGAAPFTGTDHYPLLEFLHAARDNFGIDLREQAAAYFKLLPAFDLLSYYPAPWPAPENEFRIPFSRSPGEPDLRAAALSRAAELSMVAYDANAPESQFLQGWLTDDRFMMRDAFGAAYEFLWANPYQPGLSYDHVPLSIHDRISGRFAARSSWADDAVWAGLMQGTLEEFRDGRVAVLDQRGPHAPLELGPNRVHFAAQSSRLEPGAQTNTDVFIVGLDAGRRYHVEIDDEEMFETAADRSGIASLNSVRPNSGVRFSAADSPRPQGP